MPVGQVPAVGEVHPEDGVPRLERRHVDRGVRLGPGVGLHVHVVRPEELLGASDGQVLHDIGELAAAVVAAARVALRVLVREGGAERVEHGFGDEVLRGDHLELASLAQGFVADGVGHFGVGAGQMFHARF